MAKDSPLPWLLLAAGATALVLGGSSALDIGPQRKPDFAEILARTFNWEGGYGNPPEDKAGYNSLGQNVGTNHGISAMAYEYYLKRPPSVADIKAITIPIAMDVYRKLFWVPMKGDQFNTHGLAWMVFDWYIATGAYSFKLLKQALNTILGTQLRENAVFDTETLAALNSAPNKKALFEQIRFYRLAFIDALIKKRPELEKFRKGWTRRINELNFEGSRITGIAGSSDLTTYVRLIPLEILAA